MQVDGSGRAEIQSMKNSRLPSPRWLRSARRAHVDPASRGPLTSSRNDRREGERGRVVPAELAPAGVDQSPEPPPHRTWRVERGVCKPTRSGDSRLSQILAAKGDGCARPEPSTVCQSPRDYIRVEVGGRRVRPRTARQRFAAAWSALCATTGVAPALDGCLTHDNAKRIRLAEIGGADRTPRR